MEANKEVGSSSSSSLASELFGSKESPSSSSGIFGSIFGPRESKVLGRESLRPDAMANKQYQPNETWNTKPGAYGDASKGHEGENQNSQKVQPYGPCHLSSSIYYGGPDVVSHLESTQASGVDSTYKRDGGEDDSGSASRGNWWKGSLYY